MNGLKLGVWVPRSAFKSLPELKAAFERLEYIGASRAYFQVVARGDAVYASKILPFAEELEKPLDVLESALKLETANLKVSAWMNVNLVWNFAKAPRSSNHVVNAHPEWFTCDQERTSMLDYTSCDIEEVFGPFIDPGLSEVREFTAEVAREIAAYGVEEVHLDFARYPFRNFGYNAGALKSYRLWLEKNNLADFKKSFDRFRIESLSEQVRLISEEVRAKGKKLSCAVFDDYTRRAVEDRFQPWLDWLGAGLIDSAVVMAYGGEPTEVLSRVKRIRKLHGSLEKIRIGLGVFNYDSRPTEFMALLESVLELEPEEITLFALSSIEDAMAKRLRKLKL